MNKYKKAFTIIELIGIITIIGILVLIGLPKLTGYVEKTQLARIQHDVKVMETIMEDEISRNQLNNYNKFEQNGKRLGALILDNKLVEKEGYVKRIEDPEEIKSLTSNNSTSKLMLTSTHRDLGMGGVEIIQNEFTNPSLKYKIIPRDYKEKSESTLDGTFYTNENGKVYYEPNKPIGKKSVATSLACSIVPQPDYTFEHEIGKIVKYHGTAEHLVIPTYFLVDGQCWPVRIIGKGAFMQGGYKSVIIPPSTIPVLVPDEFMSKIVSVTIPETVFIIEENAFKDQYLRNSMYIPGSVKQIGDNAFSGNNVTNIVYGGSKSQLTYAGSGEGISIQRNGHKINHKYVVPTAKQVELTLQVSSLPGKGKVGTVIRGNNRPYIPPYIMVNGEEIPIMRIAEGAYQGLGLITVHLPETLEIIGDYAFSGNQLIGIEIPKSVRYIGNYAFSFNEVFKVGEIPGPERRSTMKTILLKNLEQVDKIVKVGDIYENNVKIDKFSNKDNKDISLKNNIWVTSIGNIVIDEEYINKIENLNPEEPIITPEVEPDLTKYEEVVYIDNKDGNQGILMETLANAKSGDLIYLNKGTYYVNTFDDIFKKNDVDILGTGTDTILVIKNSAFIGRNIKNKISRLIIEPADTFPKVGYLWSGAPYSMINVDLEYRNVLFRDPHNKLIKNLRHNTYTNGDQSSMVSHKYINFQFINCVSINMPLVSTWSDYNNQGKTPNIKIINSATNIKRLDSPNEEYGYGYQHDILSKITSLEYVVFDDKYNITNKTWENLGTGINLDNTPSHIGLYGGEFAWKK